jgi:hypothetical protein
MIDQVILTIIIKIISFYFGILYSIKFILGIIDLIRNNRITVRLAFYLALFSWTILYATYLFGV